MPSTTISSMPAHYEMLVSHSPPVFSHSPPAGFLAEYGTNFNRYFDPAKTLCRSQSLTPLQSRQRFHQIAIKMPTVPKRPCLVTKTEQINTDNSTETQTENDQKTKKKVVFADDQGKSLTEVRIMSEPSNVPPLWSIEFLSHLTQGLISPDLNEEWTITFKQPASDYLNFRQKLDTKNVSLENVIVKENESIVVGTVKVKNVSFHKEVLVRSTWDAWKTQQDTFCVYTPIGGSSGSYVLYDTFSFKLTLPPASNNIEFCVCFRADNKEFWDNNDGKNYILFKRRSNYNSHSPGILMRMDQKNYASPIAVPAKTSPITIPDKYSTFGQAKMTSYQDYSSWNHLDNESPYW